MSKPITPDQATKAKQVPLPDEVIEAFNELIGKGWDGKLVVVKQDDAAKLIASKLAITVNNVYNNRYLDVEEVYRSAGWSVEYDKPGFNESYPATYTFRRSPKPRIKRI